MPRRPLASGSTTLKLDSAVARALSANGVRVRPISPARGGVSFPITGGSLDGAAGTIEHSGGLKFSAGGKSLSARSFRIKLARKSTLSAQVGKSRVTLLNVDTSRARITRVGSRHAHHARARVPHRRRGQGAQRHLLDAPVPRGPASSAA